MMDGIQFAEFLNYTEEEAKRWREFFTQHPEALDLRFDVAGSVRGLVHHIFAVELHFANLVSDLKPPERNETPPAALDEIYDIIEEATRKYRQFLSTAKTSDWEMAVELGFRGLKASKRKMVTQALTHSMRHWAQIATFLRQQGFKQDWYHDFLMSNAMQ